MDYIRKTLAIMTLGLGFSGLLAGFQTKAAETPKDIIEIQPKDFTSTYLLDEKTREEIRKGNNLHGFGEADYAFEASEDAWREFWVQEEEASSRSFSTDAPFSAARLPAEYGSRWTIWRRCSMSILLPEGTY